MAIPAQPKKKQTTFYLTDEAIRLIDHIYALRIIDKNKTTKGRIIEEALTLLADTNTGEHDEPHCCGQ